MLKSKIYWIFLQIPTDCTLAMTQLNKFGESFYDFYVVDLIFVDCSTGCSVYRPKELLMGALHQNRCVLVFSCNLLSQRCTSARCSRWFHHLSTQKICAVSTKFYPTPPNAFSPTPPQRAPPIQPFRKWYRPVSDHYYLLPW